MSTESKSETKSKSQSETYKPIPVLGLFKNIIPIPDSPVLYNVEEERKNVFKKDKDGCYVCNKHDIDFLPEEYKILLNDINTICCPQEVVDGLLEMYKDELEQNVSINAYPNCTNRIDNTKYIIHCNMVYAFYNPKGTIDGGREPENTIVSFKVKSGLYKQLKTVVYEQLVKEFEKYMDKDIDACILNKVFESIVYEKDISGSVDKFVISANHKKDSSNVTIVMLKSIFMGARYGFITDSNSLFKICEIELK